MSVSANESTPYGVAYHLRGLIDAKTVLIMRMISKEYKDAFDNCFSEDYYRKQLEANRIYHNPYPNTYRALASNLLNTRDDLTIGGMVKFLAKGTVSVCKFFTACRSEVVLKNIKILMQCVIHRGPAEGIRILFPAIRQLPNFDGNYLMLKGWLSEAISLEKQDHVNAMLDTGFLSRMSRSSLESIGMCLLKHPIMVDQFAKYVEFHPKNLDKELDTCVRSRMTMHFEIILMSDKITQAVRNDLLLNIYIHGDLTQLELAIAYDKVYPIECSSIVDYDLKLDALLVMIETNYIIVQEGDFELAARAGNVCLFRVLLQHNKIEYSDWLVEYAFALGDSDVIQLVLRMKTHAPSTYFDSKLVYVCARNDVNTVRLLLDLGDPSYKDSQCLIEAASRGDIAIVRALLEDYRADPTAQNDRAIRIAFTRGYNDIVNEILWDGRTTCTILQLEEGF